MAILKQKNITKYNMPTSNEIFQNMIIVFWQLEAFLIFTMFRLFFRKGELL